MTASNISRTCALTFARTLVTLGLLCPVTLLHAEWTGGLEGGTVLEGEDKGTRLRFKMSNNERPFSQYFYADWLRGESNANSYEVGYKPRYWFSDQVYSFAEASVKTSSSFSIDQQQRIFGGAGIELLNNDSQFLFVEAGVGRIVTKYDNILGTSDKVTSDTALARIGASQILSNLLKLELDADYSTAEELVETKAEAGISVNIPGGAIKYSYRVRSSKLGDADSTEVTDSTVSFNYGF